MMTIDPAFWTGLFSVVAAAILAGRHLITRVFTYLSKMAKQRTDDAVMIESLKNQYTAKMLDELQSTSNMLKSVLLSLQSQVNEIKGDQKKVNTTLQEEIKSVQALLASTQEIVGEVRDYYIKSQDSVSRVRAGGLMVLKRLETVEEKVKVLGKVIIK